MQAQKLKCSRSHCPEVRSPGLRDNTACLLTAGLCPSWLHPLPLLPWQGPGVGRGGKGGSLKWELSAGALPTGEGAWAVLRLLQGHSGGSCWMWWTSSAHTFPRRRPLTAQGHGTPSEGRPPTPPRTRDAITVRLGSHQVLSKRRLPASPDQREDEKRDGHKNTSKCTILRASKKAPILGLSCLG
ncbi:hypothetical protein VULLAG_LOCUS19305 [Vulpes lagopus]